MSAAVTRTSETAVTNIAATTNSGFIELFEKQYGLMDIKLSVLSGMDVTPSGNNI